MVAVPCPTAVASFRSPGRWLALTLGTLVHAGCSPQVSSPPDPAAARSVSLGESETRPIAALGRIEPRGGVISIAGTPGARVSDLKVVEGASVKRGDILFRLAAYAMSDANCAAAAARVADAEKLLELEARNSALLAEDLALKEEQVRQIGPLEIRSQREQVATLQKAAKKAEVDRDRLESLRRAGSQAVSEQQLEGVRLEADRARAELQAARALLEKAERDHEISLRKVAQDKKALGVATQKALLAAQLDQAQAAVRVAEAQRDAAEVRSPIAGQVLRVLTREGESIGNQPVLQVGDTDHMVVIAEVSELDILRLRNAVKARPAAATITALKDELKLSGRVIPDRIGRIVGRNGLLSLDPAASVDRRVVDVEIELDGASCATARELSGLQVDVLVSLETPPDPETKGAPRVAEAPAVAGAARTSP